MRDMKLIMEGFHHATKRLVREGLTRDDVLQFLDEVPYDHPLPPFANAGPGKGGDSSKKLFIKHLQSESQKGNRVMNLDELEDLYFDYWEYLARMMDPDDISHL